MRASGVPKLVKLHSNLTRLDLLSDQVEDHLSGLLKSIEAMAPTGTSRYA
jgi:hypothetical protein